MTQLYTSYAFMATLSAVCILWPDEAMEFSLDCYFHVRLIGLNWQCFWMELRMHRALSKILKDMGQTPPPFKFVLVQDRDWSWLEDER